jgi:hypothetical protein
LPLPQRLEDLRLLWEPSLLVLREEARVVDGNDEDPAAAADDLAVDAEFAFDLSRQTGGSGEIVSNAAVVDSNVHIVRSQCSGASGQWSARAVSELFLLTTAH